MDKIADKLLADRVGVIRTDTVYGLVCLAVNEKAVQRLYKIKNRDSKPGTVIASGIDQLVELGLKRRYLKAVEQYWPGQVSVVIPSVALSHIHLGVTSIACRVASGPGSFIELLSKTGALLSTSANMPGEPTANSIEEAKEIFGDTVDFYLDGGIVTDPTPSTVLRVVDDAVEVLRQGAVKIK